MNLRLAAIFSGLCAVASMLTCCTGCNGTTDSFGQFVTLSEAGWAYGDTVKIRPEWLDTMASKQLSVAIRHNDSYLYRNVWIEVSLPDTAGNVLRDTVNLVMADQYGRWLGKGIGSSYQCSQKISRPVNIAAGTDVSLRHVMRVDTLKGIEQIGIIIEPESN